MSTWKDGRAYTPLSDNVTKVTALGLGCVKTLAGPIRTQD